jgi:hypothetical protein
MNIFIINYVTFLFRKMPRIVISLIIRIFIKKRKENGNDSIFYSKSSNKITVLMLDSGRYRGDIDFLSKSKKIRVLHIREGFQNFLVKIFLKEDVQLHQLTNIKLSSNIYNQHIKTIGLFRKVLRHLYRIVDIDCVTTVHSKYVADYYWTLISEELSVPYISLHRECNLMSPANYDTVVDILRKIGNFHGSKIIVHNERCKQVFIDSKFTVSEKVSIGGALRMDEINSDKPNHPENFFTNKSKVFTLFYFPSNSSTFCVDYSSMKKYNINQKCWEFSESLFTLLHLKILKMAYENADIDFIIKTKREFITDNSWRLYEDLLDNFNIDYKSLENYRIESDVEVHSLINKSDVICGLQSSSTVESIFNNKKVITPLFNNFRNTKYYGLFPWREYEDLYCIVENIEDFETEVLSVFDNESNYIVDSVRRKKLFKECFGFDDHKSLSRYEEIILDVIKNKSNLNRG